MASMSNDSVITTTVVTDYLKLNGVQIAGISDNYESASSDSLVTKNAIDTELTSIRNTITKIDPDSSTFRNLAAMSDTLTDSYFSEPTKWTFENWVVNNNVAKCIGGNYSNFLRVSNNAISTPGHYFMDIQLSAIPSGYVEVRLDGVMLTQVKSLNKAYIDFDITSSTQNLSLVGVGVEVGDLLEVASINVYYVTERFYEYMENRFRAMVATAVEEEVKKLIKTIDDTSDSAVADLSFVLE